MEGRVIARQFIVRGRVQGVGFRWFVIDTAERLGVSGWTRNLPDGRVEIVAQGESDALEQLASALGEGPRAARVDDVTSDDRPVDPSMTGFHVRH